MTIALIVFAACFYILGTFLIIFGKNWAVLVGIWLMGIVPLQVWDAALNTVPTAVSFLIAAVAHFLVVVACALIGGLVRKRLGRGIPPWLKSLFNLKEPQ